MSRILEDAIQYDYRLGSEQGLLLLVRLVEMRGDVVPELREEQRGTFGSPAFVTNRVLDLNFIEHSPVVQFNGECVGDGPLRGLMIIDAVCLLLDTGDLSAKSIDTGISGSSIGVRVRRKLAEDEWVSNHVVDIVAVRCVHESHAPQT